MMATAAIVGDTLVDVYREDTRIISYKIKKFVIPI